MSNEPEVRWGLAQRFEFIEWRAYWAGKVNRKDLEDQFQISTPQASLDFKSYLAAAPNNIEYDNTEKTYRVKDGFEPKFLTLSAERFLRQLDALHVGAMQVDDTWLKDVPPADGIPPIARPPKPHILRPILLAIRGRSALSIDYVSLSRQGPRTICPHALAHDGYRWHVRALSVERQEYRDYVLARLISASSRLETCVVDPEEDLAWQTHVNLQLVPHPKLKPEQQGALEQDYRMQKGRLEVRTRAALAFYFIRRHNLDLPDLPPERAQLFLENLAEVTATVRIAEEESRERIRRYGPLVVERK